MEFGLGLGIGILVGVLDGENKMVKLIGGRRNFNISPFYNAGFANADCSRCWSIDKKFSGSGIYERPCSWNWSNGWSRCFKWGRWK